MVISSGVFEKKERDKQEEFWIETRQLPKFSAGRFYERVNDVLVAIGFGEEVHRLCRPAYSQRADGRPGIEQGKALLAKAPTTLLQLQTFSPIRTSTDLFTSAMRKPILISHLEIPNVVFVPIAEKEATWDLFVVWQRGKTAGRLRALLDWLQSKPKAPRRLEAPKAQSNVA